MPSSLAGQDLRLVEQPVRLVDGAGGGVSRGGEQQDRRKDHSSARHGNARLTSGSPGRRTITATPFTALTTVSQ